MILYITRKFPPSIGGMQRFNYKLTSNLKKITQLKTIAWGGSQLILPIFIIYAFLKSIFICCTQTITCIYVSDSVLSPLGLALKIVCRKKVITNTHGRDIAFNFKPYQILIPFCLRRLDRIICVSDQLKEECLKRNIPNEKLHVIPNGVDIEDFSHLSPEQAKKEIENIIQKSLNNRQVLLTVGRLVPKKGTDQFLEKVFPFILKQYPDVIYLVVGDGPLKSKLENIITTKNYTKNVYLIGNLPMNGNLLEAAYKSADIFIMPNVKVEDDMEGFGIVVLEAGAAGIPVIATKVDGIAKAISHEQNGFLIEQDKYTTIADKTCELLAKPDERKRFGEKAKSYIQMNYSWKKIAQEYLNQFNN